MPDKHLSTQFDSQLNNVSMRVMELGGLVESQIRQAVYALSEFSVEVADQVIAAEPRVNMMEVEIDRELSSIIARRQPTARDLRLLMAISKARANLARAGDEAERIARMVKAIVADGMPRSLPASELRIATELAVVRTGEEQPSPAAFRSAIRDVIRECIYGVDLNPLAVDLAKLAGLGATLAITAMRYSNPVLIKSNRGIRIGSTTKGRRTIFG